MDANQEPTAARSIDGELVEVFDTQSESEALVVKGLLDSAGIDAAVISLDAPQDVLPGVGGMVVRVSADRADEARRIIAESRESAPPPESDITDGSAA
jgi:hypothetical protein